jgi:hypothetical protein
LIVELSDTAPKQAAQITSLDQRKLQEAMSLMGLQSAGQPIRLVLAPESSEVAQGTPSWISGFAIGAEDLAILFPTRIPSYPDSSFEELVLHEVGHILVYRAAGGNDLPRWFNEGLALFVGRPWRIEDRSRVSWALLRRRRTALGELDRFFGANRAAAGHAYALSGAFVQDMIQRHGSDSAARILSGVAAGVPFETAFEEALGISLAEAEESFWNRFTFWYRWLPILTSSATLWIVITGLFLVAARKRRQRTAELVERWEWQDDDVSSPEKNISPD